VNRELVSTPAHATLQRIVVWFRLLAYAWMMALVSATVLDDPGASRLWVAAAVGVATVLTASTFVMGRLRLLDSWWWVVVDGLGTVFILISPGISGSSDLFYGGFGLSWLLLVVWAFPAVLPTAVAIAAVITAQLIGNAIGVRRTSLTNTVGDVAVWVVSGIVYGWALWAIRATDVERRRAEDALAQERVERSLAEARATIADDIHDSVLQTLAHIRAHSTDPAAVGAATAQDRELRRYLERLSAAHPDGFEILLRGAAWEVEDRHGVTIEVVAVRDCPGGPAVEALVGAVREAMTNAAKHSGASSVSVYSEVEDEAIKVYVRDTGSGFDPEALTPGRGMRHSMHGRVERHGGAVTVSSAPGRGTEVLLSIPREPS
jgi:signal transduction histidine kinase